MRNIRVSFDGGQGKHIANLGADDLAALEHAIAVARVSRVKLRRSRRRPVPPRLWKALADIVAAMHGITRPEMLYGSDHYFKEYIPRARFWRLLRAFEKHGKPRYSLKAIAAITGHDHASVMNGLKSATADRDYSKVGTGRFERARRNITGEDYGQLKILGVATRPEGIERGRWWHFACSCGVLGVTSTGHLASGKTVCGVGHRAPHRVVSHAMLKRAQARQEGTTP